MEKKNYCPFKWKNLESEDKIKDISWIIKDKLWLLILASKKPNPESEYDINDKKRIYNHYRKISDSLLNYIESIWWFEVFFWSISDKKLTIDINDENIINVFSWLFSSARNTSIHHIKKFFELNPNFLNDDFNTSRYNVSDRFERSASNVHFVVILYIYCYIKQYKNKFWSFPILNDDKINILIKNSKIFSLQMAKYLEMWLQMSFLRTIIWVPYKEWLSKAVRHNDMLFPKDWWVWWFKLSLDCTYLIINNDYLGETAERVDIALKNYQIPKAWNVEWCPAFPKFIVNALEKIEVDIKIILNNFKN